MQINDSFDFTFSLLSSAGALVNADSTPTGVLRKNGVTVAGASITVTNISTGDYRATVTFPASDGWAIGDSWTFRMAYAISSVSQSLSWSGKMRGSAYDRLGANGAGLTTLGDTRLANLDATVSSRSTYAGGAVASVTGAVGSVAGNVGGNVVGSVASVTGAVTVGTINANAVNASALATDAVSEIQTGLATQASVNTLAGYVDTEVAAIKTKTDNLPADTAASFTAINGALSTIAGYIDTEVAAIKAKTDALPADPADASDIAASFTSIAGTLSTISGYIDTEVAAIKAKTDLIVTGGATESNVNAVGVMVGNLPDASEVQAAAAAALNAYDAPTRAEATSDKDEMLSVVNLIKVATDKLNAMIQADGGDWRFDANALEMAPTGSGGGGTPTDLTPVLDAIAALPVAPTAQQVADAVAQLDALRALLLDSMKTVKDADGVTHYDADDEVVATRTLDVAGQVVTLGEVNYT